MTSRTLPLHLRPVIHSVLLRSRSVFIGVSTRAGVKAFVVGYIGDCRNTCFISRRNTLKLVKFHLGIWTTSRKFKRSVYLGFFFTQLLSPSVWNELVAKMSRDPDDVNKLTESTYKVNINGMCEKEIVCRMTKLFFFP